MRRLTLITLCCLLLLTGCSDESKHDIAYWTDASYKQSLDYGAEDHDENEKRMAEINALADKIASNVSKTGGVAGGENDPSTPPGNPSGGPSEVPPGTLTHGELMVYVAKTVEMSGVGYGNHADWRAGWPERNGDGVSIGTVDCSGLVSYTMRQTGLIVDNRLTADGLYHASSSTTFAELKPGDLGFIVSASLASHVGVWSHDGRWLHARGTRTGVQDSEVANTNFTHYGTYPGTHRATDATTVNKYTGPNGTFGLEEAKAHYGH